MVYPDNFEQKVSFGEVRALLAAHCLSPLGRERAEQMTFQTSADTVRRLHAQVTEFRLAMSLTTQPPEQDFFDLRQCIHRIRVEGTHVDETEIGQLRLSLVTLHSWVALVRSGEDGPSYPALAALADGVFTFFSVTKRAGQILDDHGRIRDNASPELSAIRASLRQSAGAVSRALYSILKTAQADGTVDKDAAPTMRDGRLVIPVSPSMKRRLRGIVHDESATGKTVFIEPEEVVEANNRIRQLEAEEKREVIRILKEFTETLRPNIPELLRAFEFLADIEFVRAKAALADQMGAVSPHIADGALIDWTLARHPLLEANLKRQGKSVVPLDLSLHRRQRILVISGPNAGGKSVCLKTVGLLQYMLQCGMPVPMGENSRCGVFRGVFIDIGDEQSIDDDLSTYSSHLLNMKNMMRWCDPSSLLLIDEFGGGTEPTIGGAIAESVLRRFVRKGAFGVITTHYQNLKHFADSTPGVVNGAMLYDRQRMEPLFRMETGNPGSSFAVEIARKIGIPEDVIADATEMVGREYVDADKYLLDITRDKRYWEGKRQSIHSQEKQMQSTIDRYEREVADLHAKRKDIIRQAKEEAERIIRESNAAVENTIREIKESQAEKERTRAARQSLDEFRRDLERQRQTEHDEEIERKMRQIEQRRQRKAERKQEKAVAAPSAAKATPTAQADTRPVVAGDSVRIEGQMSVGVVDSVNGKQATVTFGMMRTIVDVKRLRHAAMPKQESGAQTVSFISRQTVDQVRQKHLEFRQDIDVRGMRGDEAVSAVMYFIDDAILVGASRVRILHGTGTGALRQLIRQYLATVPGVKSCHDEHVQFGGAGITVVEL